MKSHDGFTGLFKRGSSYYLRIVLPKHHTLHGKYAKGNSVRTLGACSHREAVRRGTIKRAEVLAGLQLSTPPQAAGKAPAAPQMPPTARPALASPAKGLQPLEGQQEALCRCRVRLPPRGGPVRGVPGCGGVDHKVQDCITGHETGGSTGTKVYQHTDEQDLLVAIESFDYKPLDLPRVYPGP